MSADPITSLGDAASEALKMANTLIEKHYEQKYEVENQERMGKWSNIINSNPMSPADIDQFMCELLVKAGAGAGRVGDVNIETPLDTLDKCIQLISLGIKKDALIAAKESK